jgi:hypothetical protein
MRSRNGFTKARRLGHGTINKAQWNESLALIITGSDMEKLLYVLHIYLVLK